MTLPGPRILGLVALALFGLAAGSARAQAVIRTQDPCPGYCIVIQGSLDALAYGNVFSFFAPGRGTASVTFSGSMMCSVPPKTKAVVDIASQIVSNGTTSPDPLGPGGVRSAVVLLPSSGGTSDSFNLGATRVFTIASAGTRTYYYSMRKLRLDPGAKCYVSGLFSIVFVP